MRDQGRLTNWNDDKGFGFVTPDEGGLRAFVHIRSFSYRTRRPRNGDVITYQLAWDKDGRPRAENVSFQGVVWFIVVVHLAGVVALAMMDPRVFSST